MHAIVLDTTGTTYTFLVISDVDGFSFIFIFSIPFIVFTLLFSFLIIIKKIPGISGIILTLLELQSRAGDKPIKF